MLSLNSHVFMGHPVHKIYIKCSVLHLAFWIILQTNNNTMVDDFNVVTQFPFFWDTLCPKTRDFQITTSLQPNVVDL